MSEPLPPAEYLVISRGQWDQSLSRDEIENVIDRFYEWLDGLVDAGKMRRGQRLTYEGKTITQKNVITDGPFGESKEVIGGYGSFSPAALMKPRSSPVATLAWIAGCPLKSGLSIQSAPAQTIPHKLDPPIKQLPRCPKWRAA